jgi:prepilin-type N-terminal cleavage/methylation domain-containing protein
MMNFSMKSKGFTLIEVLIALVILSVAFLGLAGLMVQTTKNNSFGGRMTEAATFAQDKLEELRAVSWVTITPGSDRKTGSAIGTDYARNWNVATNGNLKTITITINWNDKTNHSISLLSVITQ